MTLSEDSLVPMKVRTMTLQQKPIHNHKKSSFGRDGHGKNEEINKEPTGGLCFMDGTLEFVDDDVFDDCNANFVKSMKSENAEPAVVRAKKRGRRNHGKSKDRHNKKKIGTLISSSFCFKSALEKRAKVKLPREPLQDAVQIEKLRQRDRIKRKMEPQVCFIEQQCLMEAYEQEVLMEEGTATGMERVDNDEERSFQLSPMIKGT